VHLEKSKWIIIWNGWSSKYISDAWWSIWDLETAQRPRHPPLPELPNFCCFLAFHGAIIELRKPLRNVLQEHHM
jgi:hypothetical protein